MDIAIIEVDFDPKSHPKSNHAKFTRTIDTLFRNANKSVLAVGNRVQLVEGDGRRGELGDRTVVLSLHSVPPTVVLVKFGVKVRERINLQILFV